MAKIQSYVQGPRWAGVEKAMLDYCYSNRIDITTKVVKAWFTETVYFTVDGDDKDVLKFRKWLLAAIANYNR